MSRFIFLISFFSLLCAGIASAENIKTIEIRGNKRIENFTIKTFLNIKEGEKYDEEKLNKALKNIYATGLFSALKIDFKNGVLLINVEENAIVSKVIFEGNNQLKSEDLSKDLFLKSRSVFSKNRFLDDVNRLKNIYAANGRLNAKITPKVVELPHNRLNLIYEIDEGKKTLIKKIVFIGNKIFSDSDLSSAIASKQYGLLRMFSRGSQFDKERLEHDKELLRRFYASHGYPDFKTTAAIADLSKFDNNITLTFVVEEGKRYNIGEVKIVSQLKEVDSNVLLSKLSLKKGTIYNDEKIREDVKSLLNELNNEGYPLSDVEVDLDRNVSNVDVTYNIVASPKIYLDKINITGNSRTHDYVIRRQFDIKEGDPFNNTKIENAKESVIDLGYFSSVDMVQKSNKDQDKINLDVKVQEKSTAAIKLAGGFSTSDKLFGKIGFLEKNLFGRGQEVSVEFIRYSKKYDIDFSFTEPYFMNKPLAVGFDFLNSTQDKDKDKSMNYSMNEKLWGIRGDYNITKSLAHQVRYTNKYSKIRDISLKTSEFIKDQRSKSRASSIGQSFTYDKRNSILTPTSGYIAKLDQEIAGLGGNSKYLKNEISLKFFYPVSEKVILSLYSKTSIVNGLKGQRVLVNDRFFTSETDIKGFEERGIGPRDRATQEALGGNKYLNFGAEMNFPLGLAKDLDVKGHIFLEGGMLSGLDLTKAQKLVRAAKIHEKNSLRVSMGFGIKFVTRYAPFRFDIPIVLKKQKFDKTQKFIFSIEQPL